MQRTVPETLPAFFWHFVKMHPLNFLLMFILPIGWSLEQVFFPYLTKNIIDIFVDFQGNRDNIFAELTRPLSYWGVLWISSITAYRILDINEMKLIPKFRANIRMEMFAYTELHSHKYFADNFSGSVAHKVSDMAISGWNVVFFFCRNIIPVVVTAILAIIMLFLVSPIFSYILLGFFITHMGITLLMSKKTSALSKIHSESRSSLHGKIVDSFTNISIVRTFARNIYEKEYLQEYQNLEAKNLKALIWIMFKTKFILEIPAILMMVSVFYFLIISWQEKTISTGDVVFIISAATAVMHNVWRLGIELPNFYREIGVCKQALSIISKEHEIVDDKNAKPLKVSKGEIIFDNVHFRYNKEERIFANKNVVINSREKVGLVGFSGSGKTTFVNLILRLYDLESGRILIDGQDIAKVTQSSLRNSLSFIPQDTTLFHRTLTENIRYGRLDATDEEVIAASKKAHCHEFIEQLEGGYNSMVGERGVKLSGGQRQRIAIARAILKDAPILVLDEATSSLDSVTEQHIQHSLKDLMENRTVIVVAHRLSTLNNMDRIMVFHEGRIIEDGVHEDLIKQNGHYAKLWKMQAGGFLPETE